MKIEVIEFYKSNENSNIAGSLHIYVPHLDQDIRGILVIKIKKGYFFKIPWKCGLDEETKKIICYPIVSFANRKTQIDFMNSIVREGSIFMEKLQA